MIAAMRAGDPAGNVVASAYYARISDEYPGRRVLSWTPERTSGVYHHVLIDGHEVTVTGEADTDLLLPSEYNAARVAIEVIETSPQNHDESLLHVCTTPDDRAKCTWSAVSGAFLYRLERSPDNSTWTEIYEVEHVASTDYEFIDDPQADGTWYYRLTAEDEELDQTTDTQTVAISSTPDPPTALTYSWNSTTHVLTLSWTASGSSDLDHYAIRHNGGSGAVRLDDAVEDTAAGLSWTIDLTGLTGEYEFLVRAVDSGNKEEQNLQQMLKFPVDGGGATGVPAFPQFVDAYASAGGKATIEWTYRPSEESGEGAPGVAAEARIYYDNGSGTVSYASELAAIAMSNPTATGDWSWTSGVLADDTYLFVVRIATATGGTGNGIETTNTDEHDVVTNDDTPAAVSLTVAAT